MILMDLLRRTVPGFALILGILASVCGIGGGQGAVVSVREERGAPVFESWGTSGAWWAQFVGGTAVEQEVARLLFDKQDGLGLTVYRYNIGGGEKENPHSRIWGDWTKTESFYVFNPVIGDYDFDFTRDANARQMMDAVVAAGAREIILFSNSPHFSMTASGHASGGLTAFNSNLPRENYARYRDYVFAVADHFVAQGYPVSAISPINEPQWGWGGDWVGQEGCHYTARETVELLELFAVTMREKNAPYALSGPESGAMASDQFDYQKLFFKSNILNDFCDTYSGHSYWMDNNLWGKWLAGKRFALSFPGKKFEMSEWCELPCTLDSNSVDSALYMANVIQQDLTLLNAVSWQSWTAVSRHDETGEGIKSDTLLRVNSAYTTVTPNKRYYAYRHFTDVIVPGAVRMRVNLNGLPAGVSGVGYKTPDALGLVFVNNEPTAASFTLGGDAATMQVRVTDEARNFIKTYDGPFDPAVTLPPRSIVSVRLYS